MTRLASIFVAIILLTSCAVAPTRQTPSHEAMVAAADVRAAEAGKAILERGGTAVDAAIATMAVLGLVEPQSAGVGGGGFLVAFERASGRVSAFDGRESAPAAATAKFFYGEDGMPLPFREAVASGLSTGAPSLYAMLKLAHERHGKLPWAALFDPAIKLAEEGFVVSPRLNSSITAMADSALKFDPAARAYFFLPDGSPLPVGFVRKNPAYAATLRALAAQGPKALQAGPIADAILAAVRQDPRPGVLTKADLAAVKPRALSPVCAPFRAYRVCGMPPPSSGGIAVADILGLYERARPKPRGPEDPTDWAAFMWASRIAYADRDYYVADDAYAPVPIQGLLAPPYLDQRAALIDLSRPAPDYIAPGVPDGAPAGRWGLASPTKEAGTTHLSIVDKDGNAAALTASVEAPFGAERMAAGFLLNNQLTDFSLSGTLNGKPVANAVAAGKKPRSSMSPTLVLDSKGDLYAVIGSPGGNSIIAYVAKTVIGVIDWRLTMQEAIELPNVVANGSRISIEQDRFPSGVNAVLTAQGWTLTPSAREASGLHGILVTPHGLQGGADPRREGVALKN